MLLEKYEPKTTREIIGNSLQINAIKGFLRDWKKGSVLFLCGPTGVGKTLAVRLIARELNYQLVENRITSDIISSSKQRSMLFDKKLFLFDEADIDSTRTLAELMKESAFPIILTGENPYDKKLSGIRKNMKIIKFQKPNVEEITKFLIGVCKEENINLQTKDISQLARICNGDLRAALIDLDILMAHNKIKDISHREQIFDIFNLLKIIFRATSIENIRTVLDSCENPEKLISWIGENIANEFQNIEDIASAYDYLSKADLFKSRIINRQSWGLQKYYYDLSTFGLLARKKQAQGFVRYQSPGFYFSNDRMILEKIGSRLHISRKRAREYVPMIKMLVKKGKNREEIIERFGFDGEDLEIIS